MSDDLMPGAVTLEGETPTLVGPPLAASETPPGTPAPPEDEEPEGITLDIRGEKMVPLSALKAVREKLHTTKAEAQAAIALKAEVETLREKAQTADKMGEWVDSIRPLLVALKDQPALRDALLSGKPIPGFTAPGPSTPAPETTGPLPLDEAEDLARTLELYTAEGKPDIARAQKMAGKFAKLAGAESQRTMAPITEAMVGAQTGTLKAQYAGLKDPTGRTVNPKVLDQMFKLVPASLIAQDPNVAGVLYYAAKGYAAHHGLDEPAPPPNAPVITEPSGGGTKPANILTELDKKFARTMGSEKHYTETAQGYKPGAINVLE